MTEITKIELESSKYKSTKVEKLLELNVDVGNLLAFDSNDLDLKQLRTSKNDYLKNLARDNTQLLLNAIWELPTSRVEEAIVATLPPSTYCIPREKPMPKPKPLTKWQQFVKDKGLKKTKKSNVTWDDMLMKWVPRHGYKRAAAEKEKNWFIEVPEHVDPYVDMFQKKAEEKQEKVSKNEFQRLRNIAKAKNIKVPSMGLPPTEKLSSLQLNSAAAIANVSTASLGKFQPRLPKEKQLSKKSVLQNKKRKLPPPTRDEEHNSYLTIADKILNKKPRIDMEMAVNKELKTQNDQSREEQSKRKGKKQGGGGAKSGKKKAQGGKKTSFGGGKKHRNFSGKGSSGRKRR